MRGEKGREKSQLSFIKHTHSDEDKVPGAHINRTTLVSPVAYDGIPFSEGLFLHSEDKSNSHTHTPPPTLNTKQSFASPLFIPLAFG